MFQTFPFFRVEASVDAPAAARTTGAAKEIKWAELNLPVWLEKVLYCIIALLVAQVLLIVIPTVWGWQWHNIGYDNKSWSMCAPGGVMPLSQYWIAEAKQYCPGDIVSFEYRGGSNASENGPSIKVVDRVAANWVHVHGMNSVNSIPPCWVPLSDVNGKIVFGPFSLLPNCFWRWATNGWTLKYEDIASRLNSMMHIYRVFYKQGRLKMMADVLGPHQVWNKEKSCVAINSGDSFQLLSIRGESIFSRGRCVRLQGNKALVVASDPLYPADEKVWLIGFDGSRVPANSWGIPQNEIKVVYSTPTPHNPLRIFDGVDNFGWGVDINFNCPPKVVLHAKVPSLSVRKLKMVSFPASSLDSIVVKVNDREVNFRNTGIHPEDKAAFPLGDISADPVLRCFRIISEAEVASTIKNITIEIKTNPKIPLSVMVNEIYFE